MVENFESKHVIKPGETIPGIAAKVIEDQYGKVQNIRDWPKRQDLIDKEEQAIIEANKLGKAPKLFVGEILEIPDPKTLYKRATE